MKKLLFILTALTVAALPAWSQDEAADEVAFDDGELQQLLAPIALYPDTVLAHILIASTYPLEVVQAERWVSDHEGLEPEAAMAQVEDEDWDPSVKALVPFPHILSNMSDDLDWTQNVGEAFLQDEAAVMAAIQDLRHRAYEEGNLESLEHLDVTEDKETIVIEPAEREIVYIPYYDARVIYGPWYWSAYPPFYWHYPSHVHYVSYRPAIYWGPRVHISFGFFFSSFHWHSHRLVVVDYHRYNHNHFYYGYQVANYRDARHWQHDTHHRRGVAYRNPRTRDYFEKQHRNNNASTHYRYDDNDRSRVQRQLQTGRSANPRSDELNQGRQQVSRRNESASKGADNQQRSRGGNTNFGRSQVNNAEREQVRSGRNQQPAASERNRRFNSTDKERFIRNDNSRNQTRVERGNSERRDNTNNRGTESRGRNFQVPQTREQPAINAQRQRQPVKADRAPAQVRNQTVERGRNNQSVDRRSSGSEKTGNRGHFKSGQ